MVVTVDDTIKLLSVGTMSPATAGMLARAGMLATQGHIRKDATTAGTRNERET